MWILMVFYLANVGHNPSSQMSVEFNTKEACMNAAAEWRKQYMEPQNLKMVCAYKGDKK